jgi:phosphopentomutase
MTPIKRCILIIADSVGTGAAHDAARFGDEGSDTLGNIAQWCLKNKFDFRLPNFSRWGLAPVSAIPQIAGARPITESKAQVILQELSPGKDTTTGHWEIAGTVLREEFPVYPKGFSTELLTEWAQENHLKGWLCNQPASGTDVLRDFGEEHIRSGKPIVYTSADSVWQIAASEESFGLQRLLDISKSARKYADRLGLGRVIARPFVGRSPAEFKRTENRKDYSTPPPKPNLLDVLVEDKKFTAGIGKIDDIFAHRSLTYSDHTGRNETSMAATLKMMEKTKSESGLIFANYIDFDMLWGHRRNPQGYAQALMDLDAFLPLIEKAALDTDLILISADHGNDPTHSGTDHTRENVPLLIYSKNPTLKSAGFLGQQAGFHTIAKLILESLGSTAALKKITGLEAAPSLWSQMASR